MAKRLLGAEALDEIRRQAEEGEDFYQGYCVDREGRLLGVLPLQRLVVAPPDRPVKDIMEPPPVVTLAMWGNLAVAGLVGSAVPLVLQRLGVDPAVASSMFVTPVTDACGFLLLLGLASWVLL